MTGSNAVDIDSRTTIGFAGLLHNPPLYRVGEACKARVPTAEKHHDPCRTSLDRRRFPGNSPPPRLAVQDGLSLDETLEPDIMGQLLEQAGSCGT